MAELNMEHVIAKYIQLRNQKETLQNSVKDQVKVYNENLAKLEGWIMQQADKSGVKSFKTEAGTAFLTTTDRASVADWDMFIDFVKKNEAWDMLEKRASKVSVRQHLEATKELPDGIKFSTFTGINVRKPAPKAD